MSDEYVQLPLSTIAAGDILFTRGVGLLGTVIRHGSQSPFGHCGIFHEFLGFEYPAGSSTPVEVWKTAEAFGDGVKYRVRRLEVAPVAERHEFLAMKVCDDIIDVGAVLVESSRIVDTSAGYDWYEIARIAGRFAGLRVSPSWDNPDRHICSGHVSHSVAAARHAFTIRSTVPLHGRWPGHVRELCADLLGARHIRGWRPVGTPELWTPQFSNRN